MPNAVIMGFLQLLQIYIVIVYESILVNHAY